MYIAYVQISSIKHENRVTQKSVLEALQRINQITSVSDISKALKNIHEIQSYILQQKYELSLVRMKDLKVLLIQVKYNQDLIVLTTSENYTQLITDLSIDINNINDLLLLNKKGVNFSKINQNLERIETSLADFENKLKFENHDSR